MLRNSGGAYLQIEKRLSPATFLKDRRRIADVAVASHD